MFLRQLSELAALMMLGEGVVAFFYPAQYARFWNFGPRWLRHLAKDLAKRPDLTRVIAAAEVGTALWLARCQLLID